MHISAAMKSQDGETQGISDRLGSGSAISASRFVLPEVHLEFAREFKRLSQG